MASEKNITARSHWAERFLLGLVMAAIHASLIWLIWVQFGIGAYYFPDLPERFLHLPWWDIWALCWIWGCLWGGHAHPIYIKEQP